MHVLVADDNAINRQFLRAVFEGRGDQVSEVENGATAIAACREGRFDLVLMDIRMPEVDGVEATKVILAEVAEPPKIVALTADLNAQEQERLLERGFAACLIKPISKDELVGAVMRCMRGGEPRRGHRSISHEAPCEPIDRQAALAAAAGSPDLLAKLTGMLMHELNSFGPQIAAHIDAAEHDAARELVHKLRASTGYCGALSLQQAAAGLEAALKQCNPAEVAAEHATFTSEFSRLQQFLQGNRQLT